MNENTMRKLWDQNFEESDDFKAAKLRAMTARMQREAQLRNGMRTAPFAKRFEMQQELAQRGTTPQEVAFEALKRFHGEEMSDYERKALEKQSDEFRANDGPLVGPVTPEPNFANHQPWVDAKKAFQSGRIDPARMVAAERQRSLGSGDPFTEQDELMAADRFDYFAPQEAVDQARAQREQEKMAAGESRIRGEQEKAYSRKMMQPSDRQKGMTAEADRRRGVFDQDVSSTSAGALGKNYMNIGGGGLPRDRGFAPETDSFALPPQVTPMPKTMPGTQTGTPLGADMTLPKKASVMKAPVLPDTNSDADSEDMDRAFGETSELGIDQSQMFDPSNEAVAGPARTYDPAFDSALNFAAGKMNKVYEADAAIRAWPGKMLRRAGPKLMEIARDPWVPSWARGQEGYPDPAAGEDRDSVLKSYRGRIPTRGRTPVFDPYRA